MPFGILSAPEVFQRRLQGALHGLEGVPDDTLVYFAVIIVFKTSHSNTRYNYNSLETKRSEIEALLYPTSKF